MTLQITVQPEVLKLFPELRVFHLVVTGVLPTEEFTGLSARRLFEAQTQLRQQLPTSESLAGSTVVAQWRDAYRAMGVKPSAYRCSFEALARRAIAGKPLSTGVPGVDLYNASSIRYMACLGAYDLSRLTASPLELRFCRPQEDRFAPLGGRAEEMPLRAGLVVYAQDSDVLCWGLNHRDSEKTCLHRDSQEIVFVAEAVTAQQAANAYEALMAISSDFRQLGCETRSLGA